MSDSPSSERYLRDRHAIVTGGGRGIGAAVADALAARGATVSLLGRTEATLRETADRVRGARGVEVHTFACDVADERAVERAFADAAARAGDAYVLVNCAGQAVGATFVETDRALWDRMLAVDLTGVFLCCRQVVPRMLEAGAGRIVNIASTAGLRGYKRMSAYCAAKHGVIGLTRALAQEAAKHGVTVNAVCPGYTETDMAQAAVDNLVAAGRSEEEARAMLTRVIPRGRLTQPDEVASLVAWLCSAEAAAVTGAAIPVAGGEVA